MTAWKDLSKYITIDENEEATLRFFPNEIDGLVVKQDTFQGQPSGWKTFYQVVDVNSENTSKRTFKANRKSSLLINAELSKANYVLRIKHEGNGTSTLYRPTPVQA